MRELLCIDTQMFVGRWECVLERIHNQNGRDKVRIHAHQIGYSFKWLKSVHIFLTAERYYILSHHCCWVSSHSVHSKGTFLAQWQNFDVTRTEICYVQFKKTIFFFIDFFVSIHLSIEIEWMKYWYWRYRKIKLLRGTT